METVRVDKEKEGWREMYMDRMNIRTHREPQAREFGEGVNVKVGIYRGLTSRTHMGSIYLKRCELSRYWTTCSI